jgi:hypothetical protein
MGKKSRSGSGMNIPDNISESFEIIFWVLTLYPGRKIRIRDKHPGSATLPYIVHKPV